MAEPGTQRAYRAACPGCGAPVEFRSAQSTHAVCGYCQSAVVRDGETLSRIGKMAEVFNDYSPLQLFVTGRLTRPLMRPDGASARQDGKADTGPGMGFTVVGRLQFKSASGIWNEWQLALDDGSSAELSEDNGSFTVSAPMQSMRGMPDARHLRVGASTAVNGVTYTVAANETASLIAAQGELPRLKPLGEAFSMVELRNGEGEVLSVDYSDQPPSLSIGREVRLDDLLLSGLRGPSSKEDKGRQFSCPNCGSPVMVALAGTKSITCTSCDSLIDLSQGLGAQLRHAEQDEPVKPLIPLGSSGQLQGAQWQVVGFQHRMGIEPGDDTHFGWSEYLLYNAKRGFNFLVDSEEGWSLVKPTTGAPVMVGSGQSAAYMGTAYQLKSAYNAETSYVAGEFYWPVQRGQKTSNRDFANGKNLLSMEQSPGELIWSSGSMIDSDLVARTFGLDDKADQFKRQSAPESRPITAMGCLTVIVLGILILVLLLMLGRCSTCDPNVEDCRSTSSAGRSAGGSYGGYSGGGGHK